MARIRSIHPGLFTDETFVTLSAQAQILWIGLWCEADDQGVFEWRPVTLKMRVLPASTESIVPLLGELTEADCIKGYSRDGREYGVIRNFVKYQRPKSPKYVHPLPNQFRTYAGYTAEGCRPNAGTGRPKGGTGSEATPLSNGSEFGTSSELDAPESRHASEHGADEHPIVPSEFGTGSEGVREFNLRGRRKEEGRRKSPSRGQRFQDEAGVAPPPTGAHASAHERTCEDRDPNGDGAFGPPPALGSDDNTPMGRDAAAGGAR